MSQKQTSDHKFDIRIDAPLVSVCLITYNHEPYIRECLDSILSQRTNFPYELCIGEDESTDGTREICIEYAEKHPEIIRLLLRSQAEPGRNSYRSQGVYNYIETTKACRGKYVAHCDGDDVWLDPRKLQKQYDAMEADPGISMVYSDYALWHEVSGTRFDDRHARKDTHSQHSTDNTRVRYDLICMNYHIAASSAFMRTQDLLDVFTRNVENLQTLPMGDIISWCELLDAGRFLYLDEPLVARRNLAESDSCSRSAERRFRFVNDASNLGILVGEKYGLPMDVIRKNKIKNCNRYAMLSGDLNELDRLHVSDEFEFPVVEQMLYHINQYPAFRMLTRILFQLRYRINNWRFSCL